MSGAMKYYNEQQKTADEYIARYNPYRELEPLHFDLRGYAAYISKNNYAPRDITTEMMNQFITDKADDVQKAVV